MKTDRLKESLRVACVRNDFEKVRQVLKEHPELINTRFGQDQTPLHLAVLVVRSPRLVNLLLEFGANTKLKNSRSKTPEDYVVNDTTGHDRYASLRTIFVKWQQQQQQMNLENVPTSCQRAGAAASSTTMTATTTTTAEIRYTPGDGDSSSKTCWCPKRRAYFPRQRPSGWGSMTTKENVNNKEGHGKRRYVRLDVTIGFENPRPLIVMKPEDGGITTPEIWIDLAQNENLLKLMVLINRDDVGKMKDIVDEQPDVSNMIVRRSRKQHLSHYVVQHASRAMVKLIINCCTNLELKDCFNRSVLTVAAVRGDPEISDFLLSLDADIDARDTSGRSPLHHCSNVSVLKTMLTYGGDVNREDQNCSRHFSDVVPRARKDQTVITYVKSLWHIGRASETLLEKLELDSNFDVFDTEAEKLRKICINERENLSLYDCMSMDDSKLYRMINNHLLQTLVYRRDDLIYDFPMFHMLLNSKLQRAHRKAQMVEEAYIAFRNLIHQTIVFENFESLLWYLNGREIRDIISAFQYYL